MQFSWGVNSLWIVDGFQELWRSSGVHISDLRKAELREPHKAVRPVWEAKWWMTCVCVLRGDVFKPELLQIWHVGRVRKPTHSYFMSKRLCTFNIHIQTGIRIKCTVATLQMSIPHNYRTFTIYYHRFVWEQNMRTSWHLHVLTRTYSRNVLQNKACTRVFKHMCANIHAPPCNIIALSTVASWCADHWHHPRQACPLQ